MSENITLGLGVDASNLISGLNLVSGRFDEFMTRMNRLGAVSLQIDNADLKKSIAKLQQAYDTLNSLVGNLSRPIIQDGQVLGYDKISIKGLLKKNQNGVKTFIKTAESYGTTLSEKGAGLEKAEVEDVLNLLQELITTSEQVQKQFDGLSVSLGKISEKIRQTDKFNLGKDAIKGQNMDTLLDARKRSMQSLALKQQYYAITGNEKDKEPIAEEEARLKLIKDEITARKGEEATTKKIASLKEAKAKYEKELNRTGQRTLQDLQKRCNLSKKLLDIYSDLSALGSKTKKEKVGSAEIEASRGSYLIKMLRQQNVLSTNLSNAKNSGDLQKQLKALNALKSFEESNLVNYGMQYITSPDSYAKQIKDIEQKIALQKEEQRQQKQLNLAKDLEKKKDAQDNSAQGMMTKIRLLERMRDIYSKLGEEKNKDKIDAINTELGGLSRTKKIDDKKADLRKNVLDERGLKRGASLEQAFSTNFSGINDIDKLQRLKKTYDQLASISKNQSYGATTAQAVKYNKEANDALACANALDVLIKKKKEEQKLSKKQDTLFNQITALTDKKNAIGDDKSLDAIRKKISLNERLVETYKKLEATGEKSFVNERKQAEDELKALVANDEKFNRTKGIIQGHIDKIGAYDLYTPEEQLKELKGYYKELETLNRQKYIQSGDESYLKEAESAKKACAEIANLIKTKRWELTNRERSLARERKYAQQLSAAQVKVKNAEDNYQRASAGNQRHTTSQYNSEIMALTNLIRAKEELLKVERDSQKKQAIVADIEKDKIKLSDLRAEKAELMSLNKVFSRQGEALKNLKYLMTRYLSIGAIIRFAQKVAETTGYFEQQRVALAGITQDVAKANDIFNKLKGFAVKSPFQLKELVGYSKQLSAFQIPVDEIFDTTKRLADISAGLGVDMSRIILAFGQVRSASVLRGQELRQFTEAGIPLIDALAKKFTALEGRLVSTGEVFDRISKRSVSFEMVRDILFEMTEEGGRFYNMQEKISETTYGQIQNLRDAWTISLGEVGDSANGLLNTFVKVAQRIVSHWQTSLGTIMGIMAGISALRLSKRLIVLSGNAVRTGNVVVKWFRRIKDGAQQMSLGLKRNLGGLILGVAMSVLGAIIGKVIEMRAEAKRLKKEVDEIHQTASEKASGLVSKFKSLTKALQETVAGSEEEHKVYEKILSTYSEYLPKQELELQNLRNLKDGYDALTASIIAKIQAEEKEQQREVITRDLLEGAKEASKNKIRTNYQTVSSATGSYITPTDAADFFSKDDFGRAKQAKFEEFLEKGFADVAFDMKDADTFKKELIEFLNGLNTDGKFSNFEIEKYATLIMQYLYDALKRDKDALNTAKDYSAYDIPIAKGLSAEETEDYVKRERKRMDAQSDMNDALSKVLNNEGTRIGDFGAVDMAVVEHFKDATYFSGYIDQLNKSLEGIKSFNGETFTKKIEAGNVSRETLNEMIDSVAKKAIDAIKAQTDMSEGLKDALIASTEKMTEETKANVATRYGYENAVNEYLTGEARGNNKSLAQMYPQLYMSPHMNEQEYEKKIQALYTEKQTFLDSRLSLNPNDPQHLKDVKDAQALVKACQDIAKLLNFQLKEKKKGGGGNKSNHIFNAFNNLFSLLKQGNEELKKVAEVKGYTEGTKDFISTLDDSSLIKQFFDAIEGKAGKDGKSVNPFADIVQQLKDAGALVDSDLQNFKVLTKKVDGIDVPDFEAMWDALLAIVKQRIDNPKNKEDKAQAQTLFSRESVNGMKLFSKDDLDKSLLNVVKELTSIGTILKTKDDMRSSYESLKSHMNADVAYGAIYHNNPFMKNGKGGMYYDENFGTKKAPDAQKVLSDMIEHEDIAIGSSLLKPLESAVNAGLLGVKEISFLLKEISQLETYQNKSGDGDAFSKVIPLYIEAINNLIERIKEDQASLDGTKTELEKNTDALINFHSDYILREKTINESDLAEEVKQERRIDNAQKYFNDMAGQLGGSGLTDWLKAFGRDANSPVAGTNMDKFDFNTVLSAFFGIGDMKAQAGNILASKVQSGDMENEEALELQRIIAGLSDAFSTVSKCANDLGNGLNKMGKSVIGAMRATNGIYGPVSVDEAGNVTADKRYNEAQLKRQELALDATSGVLNGVGDTFSQLASGNIFGAFTSIFTTITDLITKISEIKDAEIQARIEEREREIGRLENWNELFDFQKSMLTKMDGLRKDSSKLNNLAKETKLLRDNFDDEKRKKNPDTDKLQATSDELEAKEREMLQLIKSIRDTITRTADDVGQTLGDAMVGAFREGENAARAWRNSVKSYVGDVLKDLVISDWLMPKVKKIMDDWLGGSEEEIKNTFTGTDDDKALQYADYLYDHIMNPTNTTDFVKDLNTLGTSYMDMLNNLPKALQDLMFFNQNDKALSGGIESITEDTARRLEALQNSQLGEVILIRTMLQNYIQGGGFGANMFVNIQSAVVRMDSNVGQIAQFTKAISNQINDLRVTNSLPLHVTVV